MKEREANLAKPVIALQKALSLAVPPIRIEAFDISNISGSDPVASMVCFTNGSPSKSDYRHFKIRTVSGIDDFAMINEVVFRRYKRLLDEKVALPDLILIDGGKGQLSSAVSALEELEIDDRPIISLAKKLEEVFTPEFQDPQNIPKDSPALRLLRQVRDESHRFAVTFHRKLRGKRQIKSTLDDIPGIGVQRRKLLLNHFGSTRQMESATLEEIRAVKGIPSSLAIRLHDYFAEENQA
jgi:excinuclease ABC subunit C